MNDGCGLLLVGLQFTDILSRVLSLNVLDLEIGPLEVESVVPSDLKTSGCENASAFLPQKNHGTEIPNLTR